MRRNPFIVTGCVGLLGLVSILLPTDARPTDGARSTLSPGVSACATCHAGTEGRRANLFAEQYRSNEYIRLNESTAWLEQDTHSLAFSVLSGSLGRKMSRRLGYEVTTAAQCLSCHAVDLTPDRKTEKQFFTRQGVTCTGCHGLEEAWQVRHYREPAKGNIMPWRSTTPAAKTAAGMRDLRNPVVKARLCVSCHVGDAAQGKVLTHEMFAAGHPALPPFEMVTYLEAEPRHWGRPDEMPYFKSVAAGDQWRLYRFHAAVREQNQAREFVAGAVAALVAEARQLQANAASIKTRWGGLDYARFDCYSCHHELAIPSDRQQRGYSDGPPGRPTARWVTGALAAVVAKHAEGISAGGLSSRAAGMERRWLTLRKAMTARPYGSPRLVEEAAAELAGWGEGVLEVLGQSSDPLYSPEETSRLLRRIATAGVEPRSAADPESAFAFGWAYLNLARTSGVSVPAAWQKELGEAIPLSVRMAPYSRKVNNRAIPVRPLFPERMKAVADFEGERFRKPFQALTGR